VRTPAQLSRTALLAFGARITEGGDGQDSGAPGAALMGGRFHPGGVFPFGQRDPTELQQQLADRYKTQSPTVDNQGLPGEAASDPATLNRFVALTGSLRYTVALIMEGTNDLYDRDDRIYPAAYDGLRSMIRDAKGKGIRPYLATIPPMNPSACVPVCRGLPWSLVPSFNDGVRTLAVTEGVTLVDVYQGFNGNLSLLGPDGLHPAEAGYQKIASLFLTSIEQTLEITPASSVLTRSRAMLSAR